MFSERDLYNEIKPHHKDNAVTIHVHHLKLIVNQMYRVQGNPRAAFMEEVFVV